MRTLCAFLCLCGPLGLAHADFTWDFFDDDMAQPIGNTGDVIPKCMAFESRICADGKQAEFVSDGTEKHMVVHYTFDDGKGYDSSGNGHHANAPNFAVGPSRGPDGATAWFDGVKDMIQIDHTTKFEVKPGEVKKLTVMLWVYLLEDSTDTWRTIFRKGGVASDLTPTISLHPETRRLHARVSVAGMESAVVSGLDSDATLPLRRWTHIAFVLQEQNLHLYVNGVLDKKLALDEGEVVFNAGPMYIGKDPFMAGTMMFVDEFKMFTDALTEEMVQIQCDDALAPLGPNYARLGCLSCEKKMAEQKCAEHSTKDRKPNGFNYHLCTSEELMGGGLLIARAMGWVKGNSGDWDFWMANPVGSPLLGHNSTATEKTGLCCEGEPL